MIVADNHTTILHLQRLALSEKTIRRAVPQGPGDFLG